jgi:hypothetical protein
MLKDVSGLGFGCVVEDVGGWEFEWERWVLGEEVG